MPRFREHFIAAVRAARLNPRTLPAGECQTDNAHKCTLCYASSLEYESEVQLKSTALQEYWQEHFPQTPLDPLTVSPRGRFYRTVTKRRAFPTRSGISLGLIDPGENGHLGSMSVARCAIEPGNHARIYSSVQDFLDNPDARQLAVHINYVIIRGNDVECSILLNVRKITPEAVQLCNRLSKLLTRAEKAITGVFVFEGQEKGGRIPAYYLQARIPRSQRTFRRIFGEKLLYQRILGRTFAYSPLSFSQTNQSLVGQMIDRARVLLKLQRHQTLYDLFCGYGPFSLCLAGEVRRTVGVDMSAESVASAAANARRMHIVNARFICRDITSRSISSIMTQVTSADAVLLDPPRGGTAAGVIEAVAARHPRTILHLFCDIDHLPGEIARWRDGGYRIVEGVPFDMFPGTPEMEIMVLLKRG